MIELNVLNDYVIPLETFMPTGDGFIPLETFMPSSGGFIPSGTKQVTITENGTTTEDVYSYADAEITVNVSGGAINNQNKTVTPTTSQQNVTADSGYTGLGTVTVEAMPSGTEGTPTATKETVANHSVDITPSVTNVEGYIQGGTKNGSAVKVSASELVSGTLEINSSGTKDVTNYENVSVPSGTEGTPTATKGAVSNHSVDVTPSVTNTEGYIAGGTKSGTAVNVSASELVSGTKSITENGTEDVTNYASVNVNVPNSYSASDEGKVVDGGALVSQSSATYTTNDTYDTTLIDEVTVNVSGGGSSDFETGTLTGTGTALSSYITIPVSKQCSHFMIIPASAVDSWGSNEVTGCYAHQSYYFCTSYYSNVYMQASIDTRNVYVKFRASDIQVLFATNGSYRPLKTIDYTWIAW